jgi:SM-20-related protein
MELTAEEIEALASGEAVVRDGLLGAAALPLARALWSWAPARVAPAGVGRGQILRDGHQRGDQICWLAPAEGPAEAGPLFSALEALRGELLTSCFLSVGNPEVQVALYPGRGEGYVRHRDAFRGHRNRLVTSIWYGNPDWRSELGGQLRVWGAGPPCDIEPVLDRWVLFLSEELEHSVLPCMGPRLAVTAWYRGSGSPPT